MTVLSITAGRGPVECRLAVTKILGEIAREAMAAGLACDIAPGEDSDGAGPLSALVAVTGAGADAFCRAWLGTVQWTARSAQRSRHDRKNFFVAVRPVEAAGDNFQLAAADIRFDTLRAGGPGGQHQNRTESAVRAVHVPTGLAVVARDERSQHRNKAAALARLKDLLAARDAEARDRRERREWLQRIAIERGNAVRVYEGEEFWRVR